MPQTIDCLQGILTIVPLQLLSYHLAVAKGCSAWTFLGLAQCFQMADNITPSPQTSTFLATWQNREYDTPTPRTSTPAYSQHH